MGFVFMTTVCFGCGNVFNCHPNLVPSIRVEGHRQPICAECVKRANPLRIRNGLDPIVPPPGAYQPTDESSINWDDHD